MGSGCRKTISWKNYYIKLKPGSLKTIFNFMILIFASSNGSPSRAPAVCISFLWASKRHIGTLVLRAWGQNSPGDWILGQPLFQLPCAQAGHLWQPWPGCVCSHLNLVHLHTSSQTLPQALEASTQTPLQRKMGLAHKSFLHMVTKSKQVNKFSNAFLWPGIINTLSCYHD